MGIKLPGQATKKETITAEECKRRNDKLKAELAKTSNPDERDRIFAKMLKNCQQMC